nr:MAG TPA: hypothetical protein [Crassvirales sp.]
MRIEHNYSLRKFINTQLSINYLIASFLTPVLGYTPKARFTCAFSQMYWL